jgi:hypothetical protein
MLKPHVAVFQLSGTQITKRVLLTAGKNEQQRKTAF